MKCLLLLAVILGVAGCADDPHIKAERTIVYPGGGGHVGPVGGGYHHGAGQEKYEGPYSTAPNWAK